MEPFYRRLGHRIAVLREGLRMTQAELGDEMGWTRAHVSLVEQGKSRVLLHQLPMLMKALRCGVVHLMARRE